jgi:hypothetical protein
MIDASLEWCTYRSQHQSGFYYEGKGKTAKVLDGTYKGSGIKFKLSLELPAFAFNTWDTQVLQTFSNEADAYEAEAKLVPIESLSDPFRMNMTAGGARGKYLTHGQLYKRINGAKRAANKKVKADKAKAKVAALKQKIKDLK